MIKIGYVDLDTSHPESFCNLFDEIGGVKISAIYDAGDVHPQDYAGAFAESHDIPLVVDNVEDMVGKVDGALVLGVDWDVHLKRARPLLEAGIPVFIDKPVFGKLKDGYELEKVARENGAPLMGGSSTRYDDNVREFVEKIEDWSIETAFASGPNDFFYYGTHTIELVETVMGGTVKKVRCCGRARELYEIVYEDGRIVWLQLESARPFSISVFSEEKETASVRADHPHRKRRLLETFMEMVKTGKPPVPFSRTLDATAILIACHKARGSEDYVYLDDLGLDEGPCGGSYVAKYAAEKMRRKNS